MREKRNAYEIVGTNKIAIERIKEEHVNVKSFCSFLAEKYVGFWQRNLEGEIPSFKSLL